MGGAPDRRAVRDLSERTVLDVLCWQRLFDAGLWDRRGGCRESDGPLRQARRPRASIDPGMDCAWARLGCRGARWTAAVVLSRLSSRKRRLQRLSRAADRWP